MNRQIRKGLMSAAVVAFCAISSVAAAGGIGGRPANPDPDNPRSQSIFIYTLKGGETKQDQLYLSNGGDTTETVRLYAVDGTVTNTGAFTCEQEAETSDDMGKYVQLAQDEVTIPGGGDALVDFTLTLPDHADVGEHDGCIVIQKKDDASQQSGSVILYTRSAVRAAVIVPGDIHREVSIDAFDAGQLIQDTPTTTHMSHSVMFGKKLNMQLGLKNSGNVSADVDTSVVVRDLFGSEVARNSGQYAVIADTTFVVNYNNEYHPFFGGWYKVKASIAYDKQAGSFGVADNAQLLRVESPEVIVFFWPSEWLLLIVGGTVVLMVFMGVRKRFSKHKKPSRTRSGLKKPAGQVVWDSYEAKSGDTLEALARKSGTTLSQAALLNKLPFPYRLMPGQKIYLPRKK